MNPTFKPNNNRRSNPYGWRVYLGNRKTGEIFRVTGGWQYVPKGRTEAQGGEVFTKLDDCKQSLR